MPRKAQQTKPAQVDPVEKILRSVIPTQSLSPESFTRLCSNYPAREAAAVYMYRLEPRIDRRKAGHQYTYIEKLALTDEPIDGERLMPQHGSGKYQLKLNDENRPKPLREVASTIITINDPEHPPVVPLEELVWEARENRSYVQGLRARGIVPPATETAAAPETHSAVDGLVETNRALLREMISGRQQRPDPLGDVAKAAGAVRQMADAVRPPEPEGGGIVRIILDHSLRLEHMLLEERKQGPAPPSDFEILNKGLGLLDQIEKRRPRAGRESSGRPAMEILPAILESGADLLKAASPLVLGLFRPGAARAAEVVEDESPATIEGPETEQEQPMVNQIQAMMALGQQAMLAFRRGVSGHDFAHSVEVLHPDMFERLTKLEEADVMAALQAAPVWAQLASREQEVRAWVRDFLSVRPAEPAEVKTP